jgi:hypothetical protein
LCLQFVPRNFLICHLISRDAENDCKCSHCRVEARDAGAYGLFEFAGGLVSSVKMSSV